MADVPACPLLHPRLNQLLGGFRHLLSQYEIPPYEPATVAGLMRGVSLRVAQGTGEATALIITGRREFPHKQEFVARWRERCPYLVGVAHAARTRASQSLRGRLVGKILGRPLQEQVGGLCFQVSPRSFFQINPALLPSLWETIQEGLSLTGKETVVDAYCGVGPLALRLAPGVGRTVGIEENPWAVRDARVNARKNHIGPFEIVREQAESALPRLAAQRSACDILILDPPRRGCHPSVLHAAGALQPQKIVYVSCDPATLARDLRALTQGEYLLERVQPLDFFPQTYHLECVATLTRTRT